MQLGIQAEQLGVQLGIQAEQLGVQLAIQAEQLGVQLGFTVLENRFQLFGDSLIVLLGLNNVQCKVLLNDLHSEHFFAPYKVVHHSCVFEIVNQFYCYIYLITSM